jgi:hypothetical protein
VLASRGLHHPSTPPRTSPPHHNYTHTKHTAQDTASAPARRSNTEHTGELFNTHPSVLNAWLKASLSPCVPALSLTTPTSTTPSCPSPRLDAYRARREGRLLSCTWPPSQQSTQITIVRDWDRTHKKAQGTSAIIDSRCLFPPVAVCVLYLWWSVCWCRSARRLCS